MAKRKLPKGGQKKVRGGVRKVQVVSPSSITRGRAKVTPAAEILIGKGPNGETIIMIATQGNK